MNLEPTPGFGHLELGLAEALYTFLLVFLVLNTAASTKNSQNQFFGLAIGFTVIAGGYGAGHISGGCFNPAIALAIDVSSAAIGFGYCLPYVVFEFAGAFLAVTLFHVCRPEERKKDREERELV